jgi:DNA-binding SARP family transcriptional activator/basic membrane lipoprotein Med (substrate-binding protein (PBP1-ABC) superfamily)
VTSGSHGLELRILGPLEALSGDLVLPLGGGKQRIVLATLLLRAGEVVSSAQLVDELWGESPPASASHTLEVYVSRLRQLFDGLGMSIARRGSGYVLEIGDAALDARSFVELAGEVAHGAASTDHMLVVARASEALALWRGRALADVDMGPIGRVEADRLEELRLRTQEIRVDAELALGRHEHAVGELQSLVAQNPYRERFVAQLMLALYRSGRHAEALDAYERIRRRLDDDLGLQPSADLQQLSAKIVRQEPALGGAGEIHLARETSARVHRRRLSRLMALGAAVAAALALAAAGGARQPDVVAESSGIRAVLVLQRTDAEDPSAAAKANDLEDAVGSLSHATHADADAELVEVNGRSASVARVTRLLDAGRYDLVLFAVSRDAARRFALVAKALPETQSVFIDATLEELGLTDTPNATAIRFATEGPAQLAGALAGLVRTPAGDPRLDAVSFLAARPTAETTRRLVAFRRGVVRARPAARVTVAYTGETLDPTSCEQVANAQIDAGADVLFVNSGRCGTGALAVARARGVSAISGDGVSGARGNVLASIFKDWDNAVYSAVGAFAEGKLPRGENVVLSLDGYNVGLEMNATLPKGIASRVVNLCTDVRLHQSRTSIPTVTDP